MSEFKRMPIKGFNKIKTMRDYIRSRARSTPKQATLTRAELYIRNLKMRKQFHADYVELKRNWSEIGRRYQMFLKVMLNQLK